MLERKTKIIATLGPATDSLKMVESLIDAGMNVARFNFSHGDYETHLARFQVVRKAAENLGKKVGILADTKGPEIRTGKFEAGKAFFEKGQQVKIVFDGRLGNDKVFSIDNEYLYKDIKEGDYLLIDDGKMKFSVITKDLDYLEVINHFPGFISDRKNVLAPNVKLSMPYLSKKDQEDLLFACETGFDMFALSFVRRKEDVLLVRDFLRSKGFDHLELIAKIENQEGFDHLDEILDVVEGVMVARGDLGVEVTTPKVPLYQKEIIARANAKGKPSITATHMLESMMQNARPTRAEASDVANAILDGTDAIMLSGETAVGLYPVEAITVMDEIARTIEPSMNYKEILRNNILSSKETVSDAIGIAVTQSALSLPFAKVIVAFTETGGTAKRVCKFRPSVPIVAITSQKSVCEKLSYYRGVHAVYHEHVASMEDYDMISKKMCKALGFNEGDYVIITSGFMEKSGTTNTMRIIEI